MAKEMHQTAKLVHFRPCQFWSTNSPAIKLTFHFSRDDSTQRCVQLNTFHPSLARKYPGSLSFSATFTLIKNVLLHPAETLGNSCPAVFFLTPSVGMSMHCEGRFYRESSVETGEIQKNTMRSMCLPKPSEWNYTVFKWPIWHGGAVCKIPAPILTCDRNEYRWVHNARVRRGTAWGSTAARGVETSPGCCPCRHGTLPTSSFCERRNPALNCSLFVQRQMLQPEIWLVWAWPASPSNTMETLGAALHSFCND